MKRSAPESGYVGGTKNQYRRNVWAAFKAACGTQGWSKSQAHALLMPSAEGKEIDVALAAGFRENRLHVVDKNPAIVAHLKRRYSKINTYGVDIGAAAERIRRSGVRLKVANLDLCSNVSWSLCEDVLAGFSDAQCLDDVSYVALTVLRGRERTDIFNPIAERPDLFLDTWDERFAHVNGALGATDRLRIAYASMFLCGKRVSISRARHSDFYVVKADTYKSTAGSQTMLWFVQQQVVRKAA